MVSRAANDHWRLEVELGATAPATAIKVDGGEYLNVNFEIYS
jgi:hypothetical protein